MGRSLDTRAVAVPLAATLALGFLILAAAVYQVSVVPAETAKIEYDHSETVRGEFVGLSDSITVASTEGTPAPSSVSLGITYPLRAGFVGPRQATGVFETVDLGGVTVENASYPDTENPDRRYSTTGIRYEPGYTRYEVGAETWIEHGVAVRRADSGSAVGLSEQRLVEGSQLSLVLLNGSLSQATSGQVMVPNRPVSVDETTVELRANESVAGNLTIQLPTRLNESTWKRLLATERAPAGNVTNVSVRPGIGTDIGELRIELANGTYDLDVASVAVGSGVQEPEPAYIQPKTDGYTVSAGTTVPVSVEVRDRYDNPLSGVRVEFTDDSDTVIVSDERGVATYEYNATGSGSVSVSLVDSGFGVDPETVSFTVVS